MRQILVVAHQTAGGEHLADLVRARMADQPCEFMLLVPQTPSDLMAGGIALGPMEGNVWGSTPYSKPQGDAYQVARGQLEVGLSRLRELGATVVGEVGPADPFDGIRELMGRRQFDEIIISTLPKRISRWTHQDLPRRVERKFKLPVTVVTPT